jgi:amino acid permease
MSTLIHARHGGHHKRPAPGRAEQKARALGLTSATGLVVGSIVGTGVFAMPAVLAGAGTSSILVLGVIAVGVVIYAFLKAHQENTGQVPVPAEHEAEA